jgi:glycosyltransferase involved in cell wall biosynthesis
MKILIVLFYYDRPNMVRFALDSIEAQQYDDLEVAFIDDGSVIPGKPLVKQYSFADKVRFYNTHDSKDKKIAQGGSRIGLMANRAMERSTSDICLMLCDDDALVEGYLAGLSEYYESHEFIAYSYGHVIPYKPRHNTKYGQIQSSGESVLNKNILPIDPYCMVDASQVSWRTRASYEAGVRFPHPQTSALDATLYKGLHSVFGPCVFNGLSAQYKGLDDDQLGSRGDMYDVFDMDSYG